MASQSKDDKQLDKDNQVDHAPGVPKDKKQQEHNQQELGVGRDHRTDKMKEEHRGTFP